MEGSRKRGREESPPPAELKANVTESKDGEISMSVEETNRIRALLGLRPLDVGKPSKEKEAVDNFRQKKEAEQKAREAKEIAERLEKARDMRLLHAKLSGPGLADVDAGTEGELLSAADWVKRSRKVSEKERAQALTKKLEQEEKEQYDAADMQGLAIVHSAKDFSAGHDIILTLADSSVLDKDERGRAKGLLDQDDVLENVNLAEAQRKAERDKIIKRAKQPAYTGYDDAEFEEGAAVGVAARSSILPQYDKQAPQGPKLVIGAGGAVRGTGNGGEAAMDVVETGEKRRDMPASLRVDIKDADEYYTKAEYSTFQKKGKDKTEKKKKKLRKKEAEAEAEEQQQQQQTAMVAEEDEEAEAGAEGRGLEALLKKSGAVGSAGGDLRSRGAGSSASNAKAQEEQRRAAYDAAAARAGAKASGIAALQPKPAPPAEELEDDADIALSLARARRLALQQQHKQQQQQQQQQPDEQQMADTGAMWTKQRVAEQQQQQRQLDQQRQQQQEVHNESKSGSGEDGTEAGADGWDAVGVDGRRADGTLVFSATTAFSARLQAQINETARGRAEAAVRASERQGEAAAAAAAAAAAMDDKEAHEEVDNDQASEGGEEEEGEVLMDTDEASASSSLIRPAEPLVATGMAATLALLKSTGELRAEEKLVGRAKDAKAQDPSARDFNVKLEYRDETGRKLTQKEAFRQINYQFHGVGPGKKKQEKRIKQLQLEERAASSRVVTGDGGTLTSLLKAQQATGSAFITVQGSNAAIGAGSAASGASLTPAELAAQLYEKKLQHEQKKTQEHDQKLSKQEKGKGGKKT